MAGSLIWLSTRTRPDIAYAQSRISSMATKAPQRAVLEGLRVLRYLQGTRSLGLSFQMCDNARDLIAYTDANFGVKRSQSGTVIKLGLNTVAWRSAKQAKSVLSTAESEVYACACTTNMADYVKELRESICLATPTMEIMCDNKAAIVLATGEGSWKTKSASNKVHYLKELVAWEVAKVTYVPTHLQAADSLTKFLKGGSEQKIACKLMGMDNYVGSDQAGGKSPNKACGARLNRARIARVCVPERTLGPRGEKKNSDSLLSVAISDQPHQVLCEALFEEATAAMVKVVCAEGSNKETWRFSSSQDLREWLKENSPDELPSDIDAVDIMTLGCRTSPVPIKFLDEQAVCHSVAHYR